MFRNMKDKSVSNNSNLISLTYKEENPSLANFLISSYGNDYIKTNQKKFNLPICILGKTFYNFKIENILDLNIDILNNLLSEYIKIYNEKAEVILIGLTEKISKSLLELKNDCYNQQIPIDIMSLGAACRTINILNTENRKVIIILV